MMIGSFSTELLPELLDPHPHEQLSVQKTTSLNQRYCVIFAGTRRINCDSFSQGDASKPPADVRNRLEPLYDALSPEQLVAAIRNIHSLGLGYYNYYLLLEKAFGKFPRLIADVKNR